MKNKVKKAGIWILAFVLFFSPLAVSRLYAANGIDTKKNDCSAAFLIGAEYPELSGMEIPLKLYKAADVDEAGRYTAKGAFEGLNLSGADSSVTAEYWKDMAEQAVKAAEAAKVLPDAETTLNGSADGGNLVKNLSVGLYLVMADQVFDAEYEYTMAPFLLQVPGNYYDPQDPASSDAWIYDVEADLKPERKERYGDLEIVKTLSSYNQTLGSAYFVFQVEAVKNGKKVFSDVVALNFNEPGEQTALVRHIPAGAEVTVTEIYSGASYQEVSGKEKKTVIIAEGEAGSPAGVSFKNEYDKRLNSGSGIVNHFQFENGKWDCRQQ